MWKKVERGGKMEQTAQQLGTICERYLLYHLDIHCKTLDFYHSLFQLG